MNHKITELLEQDFVRINGDEAEVLKKTLSRAWPGAWCGSVYWEPSGRPDRGQADPVLYLDPDGFYWRRKNQRPAILKETHLGVVSECIGDQIQVTYETDDGPLKQIYHKNQFLGQVLPEEGTQVVAEVKLFMITRA